MKLIRNACAIDLDAIAKIEQLCFPKNEAASKNALIERFKVFPNNFFVLEINHSIIGFINGNFTNSKVISDSFYHNANLHNPEETYASVFGICILEKYRGLGYGSMLLNEYCDMALREKKKAVILTCKEAYLSFYETNGFTCLGVSKSTHGNAKWYDMIRSLS